MRVVVLLRLAFAEPAERSLVGDHADERERGTACGLYHLTAGLLVLPGAPRAFSPSTRAGP